MTATDPRLEYRGEQPYVGIPIEVTLDEWGKANALIGEILEWLGRKGEAPAGPPFFRYQVIREQSNEVELDVGVPTDGRISGDARVRPGTVSSGTYALLVHEGNPDELERSHAALQEWTSDQGHELARSADGDTDAWEGVYEYYLTDSTEEPDRSQWITEITYLIRGDFPDDLTAPTRRALAGAGYTRLDQLDGADADEIEALHGIGPATVDRLSRALADEGLRFDGGGS